MENQNDQNPVHPEVTGEIIDPHTQQRLVAVAKAKKGGIKSRHKIVTTETVKVATAFGATTKEIQVEKVVEKELKAEDQTSVVVPPPIEEQDAALRANLVFQGVPEDQIETKLAQAKEIREKLKGLWSTQTSTGYSPDDKYIEGIDMGTNVNLDAGDSGVRMKFNSAKCL